jgi:hypothetical protein
MTRAAVMSGERERGLAAAAVEPAEISLRGRSILGVTCPRRNAIARPWIPAHEDAPCAHSS